MRLTYSHLDLVALGVFILCWFGYSLFASRRVATRPSLLTVMNPLRDRWFSAEQARDYGLIDAVLSSPLPLTPRRRGPVGLGLRIGD